MFLKYKFLELDFSSWNFSSRSWPNVSKLLISFWYFRSFLNVKVQMMHLHLVMLSFLLPHRYCTDHVIVLLSYTCFSSFFQMSPSILMVKNLDRTKVKIVNSQVWWPIKTLVLDNLKEQNIIKLTVGGHLTCRFRILNLCFW